MSHAASLGTWRATRNHPPMLAKTCVEGSRFATFLLPGRRLEQAGPFGYGRAGWYYFHGQPKTIWVFPIHLEARQWLGPPPFTRPVSAERRQ